MKETKIPAKLSIYAILCLIGSFGILVSAMKADNMSETVAAFVPASILFLFTLGNYFSSYALKRYKKIGSTDKIRFWLSLMVFLFTLVSGIIYLFIK